MANWQVISLDTTTPQLRAPGTGDGYSFNSGSTQLGVWTTTGLGIGTASPAATLSISKQSTALSGTGNSYGLYLYPTSSGLAYIDCLTGSANNTSLAFRTYNNGTYNTLTLDYVGNLGLNVTPSAWTGSGGKNIEIGATGNALFGSVSLTTYTSNANFDSSWKYSRTGFASRYEQQNSEHRWYTAPSGTAGNAITFTQAMTLAATGELGIGTTSPATKLHVAAGNVTIDNTYGYLAADNAGTRESILSITSGNNVTVASPTLSGSIQYAVRNASGIHQFAIAGTERVRIDSSGRLLVGGTTQIVGSANGSIEVQNTAANQLSLARFSTSGEAAFFFNRSRGATVGTNTIVNDGDSLGSIYFRGANGTGYDAAAYILGAVDGTPGASGDMPGRLTFWTTPDGSATPTERVRITAAGNLLVGTTATPNGSANGSMLNSSGQLATSRATTSATTHVVFYNPNGIVGSIDTSGTTTTYNTSSDRRLKDNINPADDAGLVIDAIEIVKHDWKAGGNTRYGVIAQDLHALVPEAVKVGDNNETVTDPWGVDYSKLVPMLIKEVQSLRKRVAELEAK